MVYRTNIVPVYAALIVFAVAVASHPSATAVAADADAAEVYASWPFDAEEAVRRQDSTAKALGLPKELSLELVPGVTMKLVLIPAGKFMMGSPEDEPGRKADEGPQHEVTITKPFYMGCYEVTVDQYMAVKIPDERHRRSDWPEDVSWDDAMDFCDTVALKTGKKVGLPTEAQWEYACRAGTQSPFNTGQTISRKEANVSHGHTGWYELQDVGNFKPNAFGLYDVHGNAEEWCSDLYDGEDYQKAEHIDPLGPPTAKVLRHVTRGGCRGYDPKDCRSAARRMGHHRWDKYGFRVVVTLPDKADAEEAARSPLEKARRLLAGARLIHEDDERARCKTVAALVNLGAAARPALLEAVRDPNPFVHQVGIVALSYVPDVSDIPLLIDALSGRYKEGWSLLPWRISAELALDMLGPEAVSPLLAALKDQRSEVRRVVIPILYDIDPKAAADPVLAMGTQDKDRSVRYQALEVALEHGDKRALEPLIAAVKADKDGTEVWCEAMGCLFKHGGNEGADVLIAAITANPKVLVRLLEHIRYDSPRDARLVPFLIKGLDEKAVACFDVVCWQALQLYEDDPRARARLAAGGLKLPRDLGAESVEGLLQMLRGEDRELAGEAAVALGKRRERTAVGPLLALTAHSSDWQTDQAITALGEIGGEEAIAALLNLLSHGHSSDALILALGKLKVKAAVEPLIAMANRLPERGFHVPYFRAAVDALVQIGDEKGLAALQRIFRSSPDQYHRKHAWEALRRR